MFRNLVKCTYLCGRTTLTACSKTKYETCSKIVDSSKINLSGYLSSIRWQSSSDATEVTPRSENDAINLNFVNRNPRNLELMNLARKRSGWSFQYPDPHFYHRMVFRGGSSHTEAYVEHCTGKHVITASTKERAIGRYLHSMRDVAAAVNVGRVIAERCKEGGITTMSLLIPTTPALSEKFLAFHQALQDGGIILEEQDPTLPEYRPGIDFDNREEVENLVQRQKRTINPDSEQQRLVKLKHIKQASKTVPRRFANINRNRGFSAHGRLLGYHKIFHKHMK